MKTIGDYNNDLENYKNVYMEYLLSDDHLTKKEDLSIAFMKLKNTTEDIKNQIRINKSDINTIKDENLKLQGNIDILGKKVYGEEELTEDDIKKIENLIGQEIYGTLNSEEILENEVKNSKLLKDLESYTSKKNHTIIILSLINIILVLIIVIGLYLVISKKYTKLDFFRS